MQKPPQTGHHCSAPFDIPHIDVYFLTLRNKDNSKYRTAYCGPSGALIIEVSLNRTAYCGPNGVLIIEVSLYCDKFLLLFNSSLNFNISNIFYIYIQENFAFSMVLENLPRTSEPLFFEEFDRKEFENHSNSS